MSTKQRQRARPQRHRAQNRRDHVRSRVRQRRPDLRIIRYVPRRQQTPPSRPRSILRVTRRVRVQRLVLVQSPRVRAHARERQSTPRERHHDARHERAFEPDVTRRAFRRVRRDGGDLVVRMSERGVVARILARVHHARRRRAFARGANAEERFSSSEPVTGGEFAPRGRETRRIVTRVPRVKHWAFSRQVPRNTSRVGIRARETS